MIIHTIDSVLASEVEKIGDPTFLPPPSSVASGIARDAAMAGSNIPAELNPARTQPSYQSQAGPSRNTQSEPRTRTQVPATGSQASTSRELITVPIASLNSYSANWTIKAKIVSKSDIITAKNSNNIFFVELVDDRHDGRSQSQITIEAMVVDRVNELHGGMREGQIYYVSGAKLKKVEERYRRPNGHDFRLEFNRGTKLQLVCLILSVVGLKSDHRQCADAPPPAPLTYNFVPINSVPQLPTGSTCGKDTTSSSSHSHRAKQISSAYSTSVTQ